MPELNPCPMCGGTGILVNDLSPRQFEVILTYAQTGDQRRVAKELDMSVQTVKNHLSAIYRKLDVGSAIEAIYVLWLKDHLGHSVV